MELDEEAIFILVWLGYRKAWPEYFHGTYKNDETGKLAQAYDTRSLDWQVEHLWRKGIDKLGGEKFSAIIVNAFQDFMDHSKDPATSILRRVIEVIRRQRDPINQERR